MRRWPRTISLLMQERPDEQAVWRGVGHRTTRALLVASATLLVVAVGLLGLAGHHALSAAHAVKQARADLTTVRDSTTDLKETSPAVSRAQSLLDAAASHLDSPSVRLVSSVPLLGRSFRAESAVVVAARAVVNGVATAVAGAPLLRATGGGFDPARLRQLADALDGADRASRSAFATLSRVDTGLTPSSVSSAVRDATDQLGPAVDGLHRSALGARVAASVLGGGGDRHVLVALENNAELRGTGGYVSTFATGTLRDGHIELDPFRDVTSVNDPPDKARLVPAPASYHEDYGPFLADTTLFRNWNMSPDVPTSAAVVSEVAGKLLGTRPDVVLLVDVPALAGITALGGNGVILPDGSRLSSADLPAALMADAYAEAGVSVHAQAERRAQLEKAAGVTVAQLFSAKISTLQAVRTLGRLAQGRHIAIWSGRPAEESTLQELDLAGQVTPVHGDMTMVSVNNQNGNKLDYYVDRAVSVEADVGRSRTSVTQHVTLTNKAPGDLVPYVAGTTEPGTVKERVELTLPPDAAVTDVQAPLVPADGAVRTGIERTRVVAYVTIPRGGAAEVAVSYTIPTHGGVYRLALIPQPLAHDATLHVRILPAEGQKLGTVSGANATHGDVALATSWTRELEITAALATPRSWWQRTRSSISHWWSEPVHL